MTDTVRTGLAATLSLRAVSRAAFGCVLGAALLATSIPARAADDDNTPIDSKVFRSILEGIGLRKDGSAGISYGERAPLVIPSSRDLPPPERSDAALAKNPAWPNDPDIARAKKEAAMDRNRNITAERERDENRLPPDQLAPGPRPKGQQARTDDGYRAPPDGHGNPLPPSQLGYKGNLFGTMFGSVNDANVASFTNEPARTELTDPPAGYRVPSPAQPYGTPGKSLPPKADDSYVTRGEVVR
jgi:hypothetical protein